jgi:RNA polymerase sigma factor (TIGR02999 family)
VPAGFFKGTATARPAPVVTVTLLFSANVPPAALAARTAKLTGAPSMVFPNASVTRTSSGTAKAVLAAALWLLPLTMLSLAAGPGRFVNVMDTARRLIDLFAQRPDAATRLLAVASGGWYLGRMSEVTRILSAIEHGDPHAAGQLLPVVYDELRKLAAQKLTQEKPGQTLQATALVHEAYLRLVDTGQAPHWDGRGHFFAAAAEAMRRILIDQARRKRCAKHGGGRKRIDLSEGLSLSEPADDDLLALDEALAKLALEEPAKAELVKLHFFAGLSLEEAGRILGIAHRTAKRHWAYARAWLYAAVRDARLE